MDLGIQLMIFRQYTGLGGMGKKRPVFAYRLLAHATMEEKIYKRQLTKEGLTARVVDRHQVHGTMSKEDILHLFEFGDNDITPELGQEIGISAEPNTIIRVGSLLKQKLPLQPGSLSSDKLIESLISNHHPSWITNYHEHETLLQENEDEKLSKEEQDLAWEVYRNTLKWEEVRRTFPDENTLDPAQDQQQHPVTEPADNATPDPPPTPAPKRDDALERARQMACIQIRIPTLHKCCAHIDHEDSAHKGRWLRDMWGMRPRASLGGTRTRSKVLLIQCD